MASLTVGVNNSLHVCKKRCNVCPALLGRLPQILPKKVEIWGEHRKNIQILLIFSRKCSFSTLNMIQWFYLPSDAAFKSCNLSNFSFTIHAFSLFCDACKN